MAILIILIVAAVFLGLATAGVAFPRFHFGWAALFLILITELIPRLP